jgi:hypothetical protein
VSLDLALGLQFLRAPAVQRPIGQASSSCFDAAREVRLAGRPRGSARPGPHRIWSACTRTRLYVLQLAQIAAGYRVSMILPTWSLVRAVSGLPLRKWLRMMPYLMPISDTTWSMSEAMFSFFARPTMVTMAER